MAGFFADSCAGVFRAFCFLTESQLNGEAFNGLKRVASKKTLKWNATQLYLLNVVAKLLLFGVLFLAHALLYGTVEYVRDGPRAREPVEHVF